MFETILGMFTDIPKEISLGRMAESAVLLSIIWSKLKPHLKKIEDRLGGLESAVKTGFDNGETRFAVIEKRITALEIVRETNGKSLRPQRFSDPLEN